MVKITFLGTSAMIPTAERNHSSILLTHKTENILIDCGEGTQRQLRIAKISPCKITKILISHWHGDHILGIPGLIQNLGAHQYSKTLEIYGPKGTKKYLKNLLAGVVFVNKIKIQVKEISSGIFYKDEEFTLSTLKLKHTIPCLGYVFQEKDKLKINLNYLIKFNLKQHPLLGLLQKGKSINYKGKKISVKKATTKIPGKKIAFIMDTAPTPNIDKLAKNADLLITESTWDSTLEIHVEKRKHLTSQLAAKIAKKAKAKKLILTHFSQRYRDLEQIEKQAKKEFKNTVLAKDFMVVEV